jgi:hypothetical protein
MALAPPWVPVTGSALRDELIRELCPDHVLHGVAVTPLARRGTRDDVLFQLDDGTGRVAVVHLTWSRETSPEWPWTTLFESLAAFEQSLKGDKDDADEE